MIETLLKAKLHRACVTHVELDYEGSCAIDEDLLDAAGIREYQQVDIYNIANGARFTTYAIRAERGSRMVSVNGAAAHLASVGDRVIICTYVGLEPQELQRHRPRLVYLDAQNQITHTNYAIPAQVA